MTKPRVLILEDDPLQAELLYDFLVMSTGDVVERVASAAELWPALDANDYSILFMDYRLPDSDGLAILARLAERKCRVPVVMMTGDGSQQVAARAIQAGAMDYLVKGNFQLSALPMLIEKAIRTRALQDAVENSLAQVRYQATLLNNVRDAVVVWDLQGRITYWNPSAFILFGYRPDEREGQLAAACYFNEFTPPIRVPATEDSGGLEVERQVRTKDGRSLWISSRVSVLRDEKHPRNVLGYIDVCRDITRRKHEQQALRESQRLVQRMLDTHPNIVFIYDLNAKRIDYVNQEVESILGYPAGQVGALRVDALRDAIHPDDAGRFRAYLRAFERETANDTVSETEMRLRHADGGWRWLLCRSTVFTCAPDGRPQQIIGAVQDISARKLAEERLRHRLDAEKLLASISAEFINQPFDQIEAGITTALGAAADFTGADGCAVLLRDPHDGAYYPVYQWVGSTEANPGLDAAIGLLPDDLPWAFQQLAHAMMVRVPCAANLPPEAAAEQSFLSEYGIQSAIILPITYRRALTGFLAFHSGLPDKAWPDDDVRMLQTFTGVLAAALRQKEAQEALRESQALYRAIVDDHQTELICRFLADGTLTFVNETYCRYLGKSREELVGTRFFDYIAPQDWAGVKARLYQLDRENSVSTYEHRVVLPQGGLRWQEWTDRAIFDESGEFVEFQSVGRDITERKEMEEKIARAQTHLAQAARLASIGELASGVAHQINNPLTTILGEAQILRMQAPKDSELRESIDAIIEGGWRAQKAVQLLLEFSQPSADTRAAVDVNETIAAALQLVGSQVSGTAVALQSELSAGLPAITGNVRQLQDLWVNLLLLARSGCLDGRPHQIVIASRADESGVQVTVRDDGQPLPAESLADIFEPKMNPVTTTTEGETRPVGRGTGLEFSLCREIVRQHNGQIALQSTNISTLVSVTLARGV